jgi:uncharacterized protein YjbJ (UPF0337 family)
MGPSVLTDEGGTMSLLDKAKDALGDAKEKVEEVVGEAKEKAEDLVDKVRHKDDDGEGPAPA